MAGEECQRYVAVVVPMVDVRVSTDNGHVESRFLTAFAHRGLFGRFVGLNFASRKLP